METCKAMEERRFSAASRAGKTLGLPAPVAPLGLKADPYGTGKAALQGPLFHNAMATRSRPPRSP